jgi:hypothetical protein
MEALLSLQVLQRELTTQFQCSHSPLAYFVGNGTITDNQTRLIWQKCSMGQNALDCSGSATGIPWVEALAYCENLNLGSRTDWRLPNINELKSIVDNNKNSSPYINLTFFPNTDASRYWSSTTYIPNRSVTWAVVFNTGVVDFNGKTVGNYVRCVSGP